MMSHTQSTLTKFIRRVHCGFFSAFIVAMAFTTFMALGNPANIPFVFNIWDKLLHVATFTCLAFLLDYSFPRLTHPDLLTAKRPHFLQATFLLAYGILIEWLQSHTPYREASALDVVADGIGLLTYWLVCPTIQAGHKALRD